MTSLRTTCATSCSYGFVVVQPILTTNSIEMLLVGVKPFPNVWGKWNMHALEPKVLERLKLSAVKESAQNGQELFRSSPHASVLKSSYDVTRPCSVGSVAREVTWAAVDSIDSSTHYTPDHNTNSCDLHKSSLEQPGKEPNNPSTEHIRVVNRKTSTQPREYARIRTVPSEHDTQLHKLLFCSLHIAFCST